MLAHPDVSMATLSEPINEIDDFLNPNVVKVVADDAGMAMTFSRSPIPILGILLVSKCQMVRHVMWAFTAFV